MKAHGRRLAQPWSTLRLRAYTRRKPFWISKQLVDISFAPSWFFCELFSRHTTDSGSTLLYSSYFRAPLRITTFGGLLFLLGGCIATALRIKRLATSSSLPRVGCLIYLHLGRLFHIYKLRKKSSSVLLGTTTIRFTIQKKKKITITSLTA